MRVLIHAFPFSSYFGTLLPPGIIDETVTTPGLQLTYTVLLNIWGKASE